MEGSQGEVLQAQVGSLVGQDQACDAAHLRLLVDELQVAQLRRVQAFPRQQPVAGIDGHLHSQTGAPQHVVHSLCASFKDAL